MGRPKICRKVSNQIAVGYFKPQGVSIRKLDEIELALEEIEAIRLADLEGLYQVDAASRMGISRQTFGQIIARAHKKVATALICGKALRIATAGSSHHQLDDTKNRVDSLQGEIRCNSASSLSVPA